MSVNTVTLTGNITKDAQLNTTTTSGTSVLNFSIAVNDRRKNAQTGEWEDHPNFFDISVFGRRAEAIHTWCTKGTKVTIQGKLRQNTWVDKNTGQNRSRVTIICDEIEFMQRRNNDGGNGGGGSYKAPEPQQSAPQQPVTTQPAADPYDEDVPF